MSCDSHDADQLDRARVRSLGVAAHPADDLLGERDPDLVVVLELRMALERRVRGEPGRLVPLRVERQAVPLAEPPVPLRPELGTGQREREVDVEEDGPEHRLRVATRGGGGLTGEPWGSPVCYRGAQI